MAGRRRGCRAGRLTPADFLAEASARGGPAFDSATGILLARAGDARTATLDETLSTLGIANRQREAGAAEGQALNARALMPFLAQLCARERAHGFTTRPDSLILDTENTCGAALAGNPQVVSVNGAHLIRTPDAAYEAIRTACAQRGAVRFGTLDGRTLAPAACTAVIPPLPPIYQIDALPALPAP